MTYTIRKRFTFSAAHHLTGLPAQHPCSHHHGHNYVVWLELSADRLDATGFVRDFGELRTFKDYLDAAMDHRDLNDTVPFNPTAELLAQHLFDVAARSWPQVCAVTVEETETSEATYRP